MYLLNQSYLRIHLFICHICRLQCFFRCLVQLLAVLNSLSVSSHNYAFCCNFQPVSVPCAETIPIYLYVLDSYRSLISNGCCFELTALCADSYGRNIKGCTDCPVCGCFISDLNISEQQTRLRDFCTYTYNFLVFSSIPLLSSFLLLFGKDSDC